MPITIYAPDEGVPLLNKKVLLIGKPLDNPEIFSNQGRFTVIDVDTLAEAR